MMIIYIFLYYVVASNIVGGSHFEHRKLDYCAGYLGCHSCQKDSQCIFLNSTCSDGSSSTLDTDNFNYDSESKYCNNGSSKNIDLRKAPNNVLNLYQNSKFNINLHSTCFWNITTDSNDTVSIQVNRSVSNYEDVYIEVYDTNSTMKPYNSKSLSNCTDGSTIITVQNISLIVIKAKRLNLNSNYSVTVSQPSPNKKSGFPLIAFLLLLIFGMIAILAWAGCLVIIILHCLHKRKIRYIDDDKNKRNEEIIKALSSMKSGKLGNFTARFDEPKCVICLENFDKNSDVHIINECFHYFHTNCLQNWFKNIRLSMKLKCPLCQSIITHNSKLIHNNLVTDRSQNREVLEEYSSQIGLR